MNYSSLVKKLQKVCSKPKMNEVVETEEAFTEVKGLSDDCVDAFFRIEHDSVSASLSPPTLDEDAFRRFVKSLDDDSAIALVFLLSSDIEQVKKCKDKDKNLALI